MPENQGSDSLTKAIIFFDNNLPRMDDCGTDCRSRKNTLCIHRFNGSPEVVYCNTSLFSSLLDIENVIYYTHYILSRGSKFNDGDRLVFIVLTHDDGFVGEAEKQWIAKRKLLNPHITLQFSGNSILVSCLGFSFYLHVKNIKSIKAGSSREKDRRTAIEIINGILIREA